MILSIYFSQKHEIHQKGKHLPYQGISKDLKDSRLWWYGPSYRNILGYDQYGAFLKLT